MIKTCNCEDFPCCGCGFVDEDFESFDAENFDDEVCSNCGQRLDEWCDKCGLCPDCCECD